MRNSVRCLVPSAGGAAHKTATAQYFKEMAEMCIAIIYKGMD